MSGAPAAVCRSCGTQADAPPVTWMREVDARGISWLCEACTRQHLRLLEARLDEGWE